MPPSVAWLFPGQGSQHVGMAAALCERYPAANEVFTKASVALGWDLRRLCWQGPMDELARTENAQPAILAASIAALRAVEEHTGRPLPEPIAVAGHSLGEYTALVAAGPLELFEAIQLVRKRGLLMSAAADDGSGMAAVLGLDSEAIEAALGPGGVVVANDNAPGQVVISGPLSGIEAVTEALKAAGAKRVIPLKVSAAFHSPAMKKVASDLAEALKEPSWSALRYTLIANADGEPHEHAREMPALLERQVWSRVRWTESIQRAAAMGTTAFVEFGPGNVLTGLVKRILPDARTANVSDPPSLEAALPLLR
ncbi:MAG: ACP S-malonyltransferase [Candidatus Limnocylindria bacterium]